MLLTSFISAYSGYFQAYNQSFVDAKEAVAKIQQLAKMLHTRN